MERHPAGWHRLPFPGVRSDPTPELVRPVSDPGPLWQHRHPDPQRQLRQQPHQLRRQYHADRLAPRPLDQLNVRTSTEHIDWLVTPCSVTQQTLTGFSPYVFSYTVFPLACGGCDANGCAACPSPFTDHTDVTYPATGADLSGAVREVYFDSLRGVPLTDTR